MTAKNATGPVRANDRPRQDHTLQQVSSIVDQVHPDRKLFENTRAEFALRGHALTASRRADDGRIIWVVSRWGQARDFSHWHDVVAFLTQIGGAP